MVQDANIKTEMIAILPQLKGFALSLCRNQEQADDLVQATCERAIRSLDRFDPETRLDSWMFRIMQNLYLNNRRDTANRSRLLAEAMPEPEHAVDGDRAAASALELKNVARFLMQLEEDYRRVLIMVAVEGRGYQETADALGVPIGTVTSRLARARQKLRNWMEGQDRTDTVRPANSKGAAS